MQYASFDAQAEQNLSELVCLLPGRYFSPYFVSRLHLPLPARKQLARALLASLDGQSLLSLAPRWVAPLPHGSEGLR